eukprot:7811591-Alexandrium_andersonii.AAC.1
MKARVRTRRLDVHMRGLTSISNTPQCWTVRLSLRWAIARTQVPRQINKRHLVVTVMQKTDERN